MILQFVMCNLIIFHMEVQFYCVFIFPIFKHANKLQWKQRGYIQENVL